MARPNVVLVGGAPGAGKTTLGRALAAALGGNSLSADDLYTAAKTLTTPATHPGFYVMNRPTFAEYFTESTVDQLTADADAQHEAIWPAIESVIRLRAASIREGTVVIDGWYFRPSWVAELNLDNVASLWLVTDPAVLEERERTDPVFSRFTDPERMVQNFLGRSFWYNDLIRREAEKLNLTILHQDGATSVEALCSIAVKQLKRVN